MEAMTYPCWQEMWMLLKDLQEESLWWAEVLRNNKNMTNITQHKHGPNQFSDTYCDLHEGLKGSMCLTRSPSRVSLPFCGSLTNKRDFGTGRGTNAAYCGFVTPRQQFISTLTSAISSKWGWGCSQNVWNIAWKLAVRIWSFKWRIIKFLDGLQAQGSCVQFGPTACKFQCKCIAVKPLQPFRGCGLNTLALASFHILKM